MPELPEVETICRLLRDGTLGTPSIKGKVISTAEVFWDRTVALPSVVEFKRRIKGKRILNIDRRGKYLIIQVESGSLLIHLRMSGDLLVEQKVTSIGSHTSV